MALFQRPRGVVTTSEGAGSVHGMRACKSRLGPGSDFADAPSNSRGVLRISPLTRIVGFAPPFNGPEGIGPMSDPPGRTLQPDPAGQTIARPPLAGRITACLDLSSGRP